MNQRHNATLPATTGSSARSTRRVVNNLSRHSSALLLFVVFAVELGVGGFVVRDLRIADNEAHRMYTESVLGLRRIGELQYDAQETRRSTLYALTTDDSNLQVEYADQSRNADRRTAMPLPELIRRHVLGRSDFLCSTLARKSWAWPSRVGQLLTN